MNSIMSFRFETEDYENTYFLEDYYCTNPFCDCNHVTLSLFDKETSQRISFLFNFNKTHNPLPNQEKPSKKQTEIIKEFVKEMQKELVVLIKQRYFEAKAYGEKNPRSYLVFEAGKFLNYMELFPRDKMPLNFSHEEEKYYAEDFYELDPRNNNKSVQLSFFKLDLKDDKQTEIFKHTYYFDEAKRMEEDARLGEIETGMIVSQNQSIPDLLDILKKRYKEAKKIGEELMGKDRKLKTQITKIKPNNPCSCGSGKKYKKCCLLKVN